jgi:hypothetical protein
MLSREILHNQKLFFYYRGDKESSNIIIGHADKLLNISSYPAAYQSSEIRKIKTAVLLVF